MNIFELGKILDLKQRLENIEKEYKILLEAFNLSDKEKIQIEDAIDTINRYIMLKCDHKFPDGRSAVQNKYCSICGDYINEKDI